jgi:outer membrane murein-binding lipoprotein Lpp
MSQRQSKPSCSHSFVLVAAAVCALSLSGCTSSMDLFGGDKVDRIATGSVPVKPASGAAVSDEVTVRNAVSSADLSKTASAPVPWANTATGSAGVVSSIREDKSQGHVCRAFTTTRHSYEGIAMFSGQACLSDSGDWLLTAFDRQ